MNGPIAKIATDKRCRWEEPFTGTEIATLSLPQNSGEVFVEFVRRMSVVLGCTDFYADRACWHKPSRGPSWAEMFREGGIELKPIQR